MVLNGSHQTKLVEENSLESGQYDGIVLIWTPQTTFSSPILKKSITSALAYDQSLSTEVTVLPIELPAGRFISSPTGPLDPDFDDVRCLNKVAVNGINRAVKAGVKRPLLVLESHEWFPDAQLVTLLGALEALYVPIQVREHDPSKTDKVEYLGVYTTNANQTKQLVQLADILENGRRVAKDIGDADPERMSPPKVDEYITNLFANSNIKVNVVKDSEEILKEFPLFSAVDRAASVVERHRGRIVFLEYNPPESPKRTLFFVGKGVTYDTGGIDVKISGAMVGMSRDKCGAAAVAGFMQVVNLLQPKDVRVVAALGIVRNSIGSNGYVADEVLTARSGARVRIVNTDAEGRMVMVDLLCKMKEMALNAVDPHLFTVATLTGHAHRTVGEGYSIVMDNGPAFKANNSKKLQEASESIGDPFEISRIRKEDFITYKGICEGDDVIQSENKPSTMCARGHQGPAAFLIMASKLNEHGSGSNKPIKYSHLDIAASAGSLPDPATGAPLVALAKTYLL